MSVTQGQTVYTNFPAFAEPGQLADLTYNEIQTFTASEVIQPGRMVQLATDGLSVQQVQDTGNSVPVEVLGVSVMRGAREGSGAVGITAYGVGGPQYAIGDSVPVLMRGRIYAEWSGTTQSPMAMPNVYHSSTVATNRGVFTDVGTSAGAGTEVSNTGNQFRVRQALAGSGNIVLLDVNLPGAN